MKTRPILFSAPMVLAVLSETKSQTRRVIKRQPPAGLDANLLQVEGEPYPRLTHGRTITRDGCPYGVPGDQLWVRESWRAHPAFDDIKPSLISRCDVGYVADGAPPTHWGKTRPSMFMPRWASRITLEITEVRVERLQSISDADARAEGCPCYVCGRLMDGMSEEDCHCFHRPADATDYRHLWESINGAGAWDANPYCWILGFRRVHAS